MPTRPRPSTSRTMSSLATSTRCRKRYISTRTSSSDGLSGFGGRRSCPSRRLCEDTSRVRLGGGGSKDERRVADWILIAEGSAWVEYQKSGTVHGLSVPANMRESTQFIPPLFTPSTKAEIGQKDENIHPDSCVSPVPACVVYATADPPLAAPQCATSFPTLRSPSPSNPTLSPSTPPLRGPL